MVDEPLYAYYLRETGLNHPGRDEVIAAGETCWQAVVDELTAPVTGVYYQKHMTHHLVPQLPRDWIASLTNVLLIRDPAEVVASYLRSRVDVVAEDIGLVQQTELYDHLGADVPVIDAADFLRDPERYLRWLCDHIGVEFTDRMLHWPAGPRNSDGVWAPTGTAPCWPPPASSRIDRGGSSSPAPRSRRRSAVDRITSDSTRRACGYRPARGGRYPAACLVGRGTSAPHECPRDGAARPTPRG